MITIALLIGTNLAVVFMALLVPIVIYRGTFPISNLESWAMWAGLVALIGVSGTVISALFAKKIAKSAVYATTLGTPQTNVELWVYQTVYDLSLKAGISCPEISIYEGPPNLLTTGLLKNKALILISTGLFQTMSESQIKAVIAHEIVHIANGDMLTMTLLQGTVNTFTVFLARLVSYTVDTLLLRKSHKVGLSYYVTLAAAELTIGLLANLIVAWFSRHREYKADIESYKLLGTKTPLIAALTIMTANGQKLPLEIRTMGITGQTGTIFSSHPKLAHRLAALD